MAKIEDFSFLDRDAVLGMARAMHAESPTYRDISWNEDKVNAIIEMALSRDDIHCLVAKENDTPIGMLVVFLNHYFFSDDFFAADMLLYVQPDKRNASVAKGLISHAEHWAESSGARELRFGNSAGITPRLGLLYERLGYKNDNHLYIKRFR